MLGNNRRVRISLRNFFDDHRSKVFIFLNKNINRIGDLEEYVGKLFGIADFYFMLDDCYLPSVEDIRILHVIEEEQFLIAAPKLQTNEEASSSINRPKLQTNEEVSCFNSPIFRTSEVASSSVIRPKVQTNEEASSSFNRPKLLTNEEASASCNRPKLPTNEEASSSFNRPKLQTNESLSRLNHPELKQTTHVKNKACQTSISGIDAVNTVLSNVLNNLEAPKLIYSENNAEINTEVSTANAQETWKEKKKIEILMKSFHQDLLRRRVQVETNTNPICEEVQYDKMECESTSTPQQLVKERTKKSKKNSRDSNSQKTWKEKKKIEILMKSPHQDLLRQRVQVETNANPTREEIQSDKMEFESPSSSRIEGRINKSKRNDRDSNSIRVLESYVFTPIGASPEDKQTHIRKRQAAVDTQRVIVKKHKGNLICLDLPKQTNIIKSLIVSKTNDGRQSEFEAEPKLPSPAPQDEGGIISGPEIQAPIELSHKSDGEVTSATTSKTNEQRRLNTEGKQSGDDDSNCSKVHLGSMSKASEYCTSINSSVTDDKEEKESECSMLLSNSEGEARQGRRKRHRKRKHKEKKTSPQSSVVEVSSYKPPSTIAAPSMHIRFGEGDAATSNEGAPKSAATQNGFKLDAKTVDIIDELQGETPKGAVPHVTDALPRAGDLISFKILRMNLNYEPEISQTVTGSVLEYDENKDEVHVHLISGADQCQEPDGKFSLLEDEAPPIVTERRFRWKDLIESKIL